MDVLTYDELRQLERDERESRKIKDLGEEFFHRYQAYISDKKRVMDKSDDNIIAKKVKERTIKELENAQNSFKNICEYRVKKVFDKAMIDLRMGVKPDHKGLLPQEVELYESIRKLIASHFDALIKRKLKKENKAQPIKDDNKVLVRFVKDFPEFAWNELTLGPFKAEDVANLPREAVKLLINKEAVKEVLSE